MSQKKLCKYCGKSYEQHPVFEPRRDMQFTPSQYYWWSCINFLAEDPNIIKLVKRRKNDRYSKAATRRVR